MRRIEIVGDRRRAHDAGVRGEMVSQSPSTDARVRLGSPAWYLCQPDLSLAVRQVASDIQGRPPEQHLAVRIEHMALLMVELHD
jgi:hypothetical protein